MVEKFPGANTLEVTEGVEDALEKLRPGLAGMQTDTSVFRPATFIEDAIDNLTLAAADRRRPRWRWRSPRSCSSGARC